MKSFILLLIFCASFGAHADNFTRAEKQNFFHSMPEMLKEYYEDEAIKACILNAKRGSNESFVALVVIAHAKNAIDTHTDQMSEVVSKSANKDDIYRQSIAVYKSKNLRDNMKLLVGMPKAIRHCNSLVEGEANE